MDRVQIHYDVLVTFLESSTNKISCFCPYDKFDIVNCYICHDFVDLKAEIGFCPCECLGEFEAIKCSWVAIDEYKGVINGFNAKTH